MTAPVLGDRVQPLPTDAAAAPDPTWDLSEVLRHEHVADRYHRIVLRAPTIASRATPGQFVMVTIPQEAAPVVLPRPMAIHRRRAGEDTIELIYGVHGQGTVGLSRVKRGQRLQLVGPLGRGFAIGPDVRRLLLVGRGIGTCSLMTAVEDARVAGIDCVGVVSGRTHDALIGGPDYRELGASRLFAVCDEHGDSDPDRLRGQLVDHYGSRGPDLILTCGSERLANLCADLAGRWSARVQVSLEAHMACGLGYCHGCATARRTAAQESPLICKDGPVFALPASPPSGTPHDGPPS